MWTVLGRTGHSSLQPGVGDAPMVDVDDHAGCSASHRGRPNADSVSSSKPYFPWTRQGERHAARLQAPTARVANRRREKAAHGVGRGLRSKKPLWANGSRNHGGQA